VEEDLERTWNLPFLVSQCIQLARGLLLIEELEQPEERKAGARPDEKTSAAQR
jgi:hypothetical protein